MERFEPSPARPAPTAVQRVLAAPGQAILLFASLPALAALILISRASRSHDEGRLVGTVLRRAA